MRSSLLEWFPVNNQTERGVLSDKENRAAEKWHFGHRCKRKSHRILQIRVIPTGIGHRIDLFCVACGKTNDISDYDSW